MSDGKACVSVSAIVRAWLRVCVCVCVHVCVCVCESEKKF